jgi:hypothetical protein
MATRKQLWHPDEVKAKIQASQLINRLTAHALSDEPIMDASQVTAATRLLNKVVPDLKAMELTGAEGGPLEVNIVIGGHE